MDGIQPSGTPRASVQESYSRLPFTRAELSQTQLHGSRRVITQFTSLVNNSSSASYRYEFQKPHPLSTSFTYSTTAIVAAERSVALEVARIAAGPKMDPFSLGDKIRKIRTDNQVPAIPYLLQVNSQKGLPEFPYENLKTPFERHEVQHLQYMTNLFRPDRFDVLDCKGNWKDSIDALVEKQKPGTFTPKSERAKPTAGPKVKMSLSDYKAGKKTGISDVVVETTHSGVSVKPVPKDGSNLRNGSKLSPAPATDKAPYNADTQATNTRATTIVSADRHRDDHERHPRHDTSAHSSLKPLPKQMEKKNVSSSQNSVSTPNKSKRPIEKDETPQSEKRNKADDSTRFTSSQSKHTPTSAPKTSLSSTKSTPADTRKNTPSISASKAINGNSTQTTKPISKSKMASAVSQTSPTKPQKTSSMIPPPLSPTLPPNITSPVRTHEKITPPRSPKSKKNAAPSKQHYEEPKSPEWSPLSIPPEMSPTLPSPIERMIEDMDDAEIDDALDAAKDKRGREDREKSPSHDSEAEKKSEAHRLSTIERHERSRKPGAPGVAQKLPRGKHPAKHPPAAPLLDDSDDDEEEIPLAKTSSRKETHIVKIKYTRRQAKAVKDLLRLKPTPSPEFRRLEAQRLSAEKAEKNDAPQKRPAVNGIEKTTKSSGARKSEPATSRDKPSVPVISRDSHHRGKEESKTNAREVVEKATPHSKPTSTSSTAGPPSASKRPRDVDENLPPSAKRLKRPNNLEVSKPSTPVTPAFKSPALPGSTSSQKPPSGTPQKRAEEHIQLNMKYNPVALSLKREMDRILQVKERGAKPPTDADKMLGSMVGLECILAYMTAFGHMDDYKRLRKDTLHAGEWGTSARLLYFVRGVTTNTELRGLGFALGAIICEQLDGIYATGVGTLDDMRKNAATRIEYWKEAKRLTSDAGAKLPLGSWSTVQETVVYASSVMQAFAKKKNIAWSKKIDF